jgi:hypothetical protein
MKRLSIIRFGLIKNLFYALFPVPEALNTQATIFFYVIIKGRVSRIQFGLKIGFDLGYNRQGEGGGGQKTGL